MSSTVFKILLHHQNYLPNDETTETYLSTHNNFTHAQLFHMEHGNNKYVNVFDKYRIAFAMGIGTIT